MLCYRFQFHVNFHPISPRKFIQYFSLSSAKRAGPDEAYEILFDML